MSPRADAATSNITPELGTLIVGGFASYPVQHTHDAPHARCLVLDDGKTRIALVVCDLLGLHRSVSVEARRLIREATGILLPACDRRAPRSARAAIRTINLCDHGRTGSRPQPPPADARGDRAGQRLRDRIFLLISNNPLHTCGLSAFHIRSQGMGTFRQLPRVPSRGSQGTHSTCRPCQKSCGGNFRTTSVHAANS